MHDHFEETEAETEDAVCVVKGLCERYLPAQPRYKVFVGLAARCVGKYGVLVLLSLSNIKHCDFMSLTTGREENDN